MATRKLILTQEVDRLGAAGDVVEVRAGYARNLLIPRGLATPWSAGAQKQIDALRKARQARQIADRDEALALKGKIESTTARIEHEVGQGRTPVRRRHPRRSSPTRSARQSARSSTVVRWPCRAT